MTEALVAPTTLELRCAPCVLLVRITTTELIPTEPVTPGSVLYRQGRLMGTRPQRAPLIDHGPGIRCHNCGKKLQSTGKGGAGDRFKCPRCHSVHEFASLSRPTPAPPFACIASSSPVATPA